MIPQGPYLRRSMLLSLTRRAGDVDDGEVEKLVRDFTFDSPERLAKDEEDEMTRRSLETCEAQEERGQAGS